MIIKRVPCVTYQTDFITSVTNKQDVKLLSYILIIIFKRFGSHRHLVTYLVAFDGNLRSHLFNCELIRGYYDGFALL